MQGFAQAYLKAPQELQPKVVRIGPNHLLRLITNPGIDSNAVEFGYAQPGSDLAGAMSFAESLLAQYLSSQGIDPNTVTSSASVSQKFSSGVERLLSLVEKFEASKESMALYKSAEQRLWQIIKGWLNLSNGNDILSDEYKLGVIPMESKVAVEFKRPESALSETDKLDIWKSKREEGLASRVDWFIEYEGLDIESATRRMEEIDASEFARSGFRGQGDPPDTQPTDVI